MYSIAISTAQREVLLESFTIYEGFLSGSLQPMLNMLSKQHAFSVDTLLQEYETKIMHLLQPQQSETAVIAQIRSIFESGISPYIVASTDIPILHHVLELHYRLAMGQFTHILDYFLTNWEFRTVLEQDLYVMRQAIMPTLYGQGAFYGIRSPHVSEAAKIACEMHQTLRYRYYWDKYPEGGLQVFFDTPLSITAHSFLQIKKESD